MKTILYTLMMISSFGLSAQPTIGPEAIVAIGEEEPTNFLPFQASSWDAGASGVSVNWDFSDLAMGETCNYVAIDPAESPYFDSFPNSDIYFVCTFVDGQGFTTEQHTYYNVEGDILQLAGNVSISISNPSFDSIFIVFTDPLDWGTFPYSFEDTSDDTFEGRVTSYIGDQTIVAIQTGTSTQEVDSYGTLVTPSGTFENALRVKRVELAENSIPGIPFSTPQESYRYTWYAENENGVILNLDSIVIKDFNGNVVSNELSGSYRMMGPTSTSTSSIKPLDVKVFPNPTTDELNVEMTDITSYKLNIYTVDGREVPYDIQHSGNDLMKIKLSKLNTDHGFYYLKILDANQNIQATKAILVNN